MTAAYEKDGQIVIQKAAGADLSSSQYHFVKFSSGSVIECAAATDVPSGVLQNAPESVVEPLRFDHAARHSASIRGYRMNSSGSSGSKVSRAGFSFGSIPATWP